MAALIESTLPPRLRWTALVLGGLEGDVDAVNRVTEHLELTSDGFDAVLLVGPINGTGTAGAKEAAAALLRSNGVDAGLDADMDTGGSGSGSGVGGSSGGVGGAFRLGLGGTARRSGIMRSLGLGRVLSARREPAVPELPPYADLVTTSQHEAEASTVLSIVENMSSLVYYVPSPSDGPSLTDGLLGDYPYLTSHSLNLHNRSTQILSGLIAAGVSVDPLGDGVRGTPPLPLPATGTLHLTSEPLGPAATAQLLAPLCTVHADDIARLPEVPGRTVQGERHPITRGPTLLAVLGGSTPGVARLNNGTVLICPGAVASATPSWAVVTLVRGDAMSPWQIHAITVDVLPAIV